MSFDDIRIRDLIFFDRLAELGTITAAAREMEVPKPTRIITMKEGRKPRAAGRVR